MRQERSRFRRCRRLQDDPSRLKSYFLKGYSLVLAMTLPITIACALFADDMVVRSPGPEMDGRLAHLSLPGPDDPDVRDRQSDGVAAHGARPGGKRPQDGARYRAHHDSRLPGRGAIWAYGCGIRIFHRHAAVGVPAIAWAVHGTVVSTREVLRDRCRPLASGIVAEWLHIGASVACSQLQPLPRLTVERTVLLVAYSAMLLFAGGRQSHYLDLVRGLLKTWGDRKKP